MTWNWPFLSEPFLFIFLVLSFSVTHFLKPKFFHPSTSFFRQFRQTFHSMAFLWPLVILCHLLKLNLFCIVKCYETKCFDVTGNLARHLTAPSSLSFSDAFLSRSTQWTASTAPSLTVVFCLCVYENENTTALESEREENEKKSSNMHIFSLN